MLGIDRWLLHGLLDSNGCYVLEGYVSQLGLVAAVKVFAWCGLSFKVFTMLAWIRHWDSSTARGVGLVGIGSTSLTGTSHNGAEVIAIVGTQRFGVGEQLRSSGTLQLLV